MLARADDGADNLGIGDEARPYGAAERRVDELLKQYYAQLDANLGPRPDLEELVRSWTA